MAKRILGPLLTGLSLMLSPAWAAEPAFDGTQPLTCAAVEAYDCRPGADCIKGQPQDIDAPEVIRLDFAARVARTTRADGSERTVEIARVVQDQEGLILQGVEHGLGWSLTLGRTSGVMALSASGDGVAYVVFGACTATE